MRVGCAVPEIQLVWQRVVKVALKRLFLQSLKF